MNAWNDDRPIFKRLPQYGWQDNEVVDWITEAYDQMLVELKEAIDRFPQDFIDPVTARPDALDWLAQLMGYTGDYWDSSWSVAIKRRLIGDAQSIVWRYKGTFYLLDYLIKLFDLRVQIRLRGQWRIGTSAVGDPIGGGLLVYGLVVGSATDSGYPRNSPEWQLVDRLRRLYMPAWCAPIALNGNFLHYHRWRIGRSQVGDPI